MYASFFFIVGVHHTTLFRDTRSWWTTFASESLKSQPFKPTAKAAAHVATTSLKTKLLVIASHPARPSNLVAHVASRAQAWYERWGTAVALIV